MFFMLHILVFTFYLSDTTSTARRTNNYSTKDYFKENAETRHDIKEGGRYNGRDPPNHHPMFHIIKNHSETHSNNLKSNVFDKMLSEEMFSLRQNLFEKDLAYTSTVQRVTQSKAFTTIPEAKRKWPAVNVFRRPPDTEELDEDAKLAQIRQNNLKTKYNRPKIKNVDVRSLTGHQNSEVKCNCANSNSNHQCKHGEDCTRKPAHGVIVPNPVPFAPIFMPPPQYQPYFVGGEVALGLPKPTRRRKPTPQECDLYYEDDCKKVKRPNEEIIMNIDYEVEDINPGRDSCIHEDLKEVELYKSNKRKCYCSSSRTAEMHQIFIFFCVFVSLYRVFFVCLFKI